MQKRFKFTSSGKIKSGAAFLSHNLRRRFQNGRKLAVLGFCDADAKLNNFTIF